jgi:signal transduction histidine kinase/CheY-like chemotaxis protein
MRALQDVKNRSELSWRTASLRTYLIGTVLMALLPMGAFVTFQGFSAAGQERNRIDAELARSAAALAQVLDRDLVSSIDALLVLSQSERVRQGQVTHLGELVQWSGHREWESVFVLGPAGELLSDEAPKARSAPAVGQPLRELFQSVVAKVQPVVVSLPDGQKAGTGSIAIGLPVGRDSRVRYVIGVRLSPSYWQERVGTAGLPPGAHASLLDAQQRLVAQAAGPGRNGFASNELAAADATSAGAQRTGGPEARSDYAAVRSVPIAGWQVRVALPAASVHAAQRKLTVAAFTSGAASLLLGLLLAGAVARRVAAPLRQLAALRPAALPDHVPVREVALARDALLRALALDPGHESHNRKAQEFETLFNHSPIGMAYAQDPGCRVILHNAAMDGLLGPRGSHGAGSVRVLHDKRELAPGQQPLQRAAALGETVTGMELEIAIDGRPSTFVIANAVPLHDASGRPRGAISALVDITQRKRMEERLLAADQDLRESQRLMELAQEAGHVGFFHYRFGDDALTWTPGQCKLFGIDELPSGGLRRWYERIDDADRDRVEREFWTACALRRENATLEYCVARADGTARWLSSRILLHFDGQGRATQMIGITVDMTDQKESERERAELTERALAARREAEAASRAKDEFLTMLSHELRNPLGAISAATDVLEAAEAGSPTATEARAIIARQTRNLAHMMNDLLDVGRVIAGKILLARQTIDVAAIVERVHQTLMITGEVKDHPVRVELEPVFVDGDGVRIEQIVTNLLTNAIKYTPPGGPITVRVRREQESAVLEVQDAGIGIPPTLLPRIFDLFVQGERPLHRPAGGLGIGLTLVRRLVELHGGTVAAESSRHGSCFTVRFPAVEAPERCEGGALPPSRRRKVLVVEDNADVLAALRSKLELDGHTVSTAVDGVEGLTRLLKLRPEVSIVDIGLPGLTGFELARHARAAGYSGRMIALSGYGAERDAQAALVAGFDAYLVKPVDRHQLRASISAD